MPKLEVGMTFKTREKGYGVIVPFEIEGRNFDRDGKYWEYDFRNKNRNY